MDLARRETYARSEVWGWKTGERAHLDFDARTDMRSSARKETMGAGRRQQPRQDDKRPTSIPNDRLDDALFGTLSAADVTGAKDDRVCISKTRERELREAF